MEAIEAIMTRRSVRAYTDGPIPAEVLDKVLRAAMAAPSAGNQMPWEFVLLTERAALDSVPAVHPYCGMIVQAQAAVLVCGNLDRESHKGYWQQDCAAACQNVLLAAHALGLGAVWTGIYPREDRVAAVRQLIGAPANVVPMALIPLGWPAEQPGPADRFDASRVHLNRWSDTPSGVTDA